MDENIDFLLSYNVIFVCNLHVNAGIQHHYFSILWVTSQYYFALQCLRKALPSTTLYYKVCTNYFPALLCTRKLAQSTFQYYFVLQSLHKALSSTTLYYKACTKHFPVLLFTTKLAQSRSQYYFVLQSLHKALPSTTLRTTKLAQSTSQYYFVPQSLHKALPSTTLYYKACTKHFPALRRDADPTTTRRATRGEQTLRYAFGKNRIIWDEHPKSSNHQLNAILPITNQHTQNLEFCMLIVISYVIS